MSLGLDWVNDFALWVGDLFPRWDLLEPINAGIKFLPGGKVKVIKPGIYWYWPVTTTVYELPIKRQTVAFTQRLTTKDDCTVMVSTVVVFTVDDVQKALVDTHDFEDTITEVASKLVIKPVMSRTFEESRRDMSESNDMRNEVTREARKVLTSYGVNVIDAYVDQFAETTVFSHDGDGMAIGVPEDE